MYEGAGRTAWCLQTDYIICPHALCERGGESKAHSAKMNMRLGLVDSTAADCATVSSVGTQTATARVASAMSPDTVRIPSSDQSCDVSYARYVLVSQGQPAVRTPD